jgi:hypothetical protein
MSWEDGVLEALAGFVSGLIVEGLLLIPDWKDYDQLMFAFGAQILVVDALSTFTEVMMKRLPFQIGFIVTSLGLLLLS